MSVLPPQARRDTRASQSGTDPAAAAGGRGEVGPLVELLGGMLSFDPVHRLSAQECLLRNDIFGDNAAAADAAARKASGAGGSRAPSDITSRAVCDQIGGGGGRGGGGGGEGCDGSAATVSDLDDENFAVEADREPKIEGAGVREAEPRGHEDDEEEEDGRYDDDGYDDDDDDDVGDGADPEGSQEGHKARAVKRGAREGLAEPTPPPEETSFLGEPGYVKKRVVEIERKEEYFNAARKNDAAAGGARAEPAAEEDATGATSATTGGSEPEETGSHRDSGQAEVEPQREPPAVEAPSAPGVDGSLASSYTAFDASAATAAAAVASTAAAVTKNIVSVALAEALAAGGERGRKDAEEETGDSNGVAKAAAVFGEDGYDSDSFDEGDEEGGGLEHLAGRTTFFPDQPSTTPDDEAEQDAEAGSGIRDPGAGAPGAAPDDITKPQRAETEEEKTNTQPAAEGGAENPNSGSGVESGGDAATPGEDGGRPEVAAATDERAEEPEGEDGDGWRVAGAFRVLAASGPGGELAARAVKGLLRRGKQVEAGETSVEEALTSFVGCGVPGTYCARETSAVDVQHAVKRTAESG